MTLLLTPSHVVDFPSCRAGRRRGWPERLEATAPSRSFAAREHHRWNSTTVFGFLRDFPMGGATYLASLSDQNDSETPADILSQDVVNFPVSRNGRTPVTAIISPPRVPSSFTDQFAALLSTVSQQVNPLHATMTLCLK